MMKQPKAAEYGKELLKRTQALVDEVIACGSASTDIAQPMDADDTAKTADTLRREVLVQLMARKIRTVKVEQRLPLLVETLKKVSDQFAQEGQPKRQRGRKRRPHAIVI